MEKGDFAINGNYYRYRKGGYGMEENLLKERKQILMDIMKSKEYQPMKAKELAMVLNVPKEDREELRYVLNELMNEGKIVESKKGKF